MVCEGMTRPLDRVPQIQGWYLACAPSSSGSVYLWTSGRTPWPLLPKGAYAGDRRSLGADGARNSQGKSETLSIQANPIMEAETQNMRRLTWG